MKKPKKAPAPPEPRLALLSPAAPWAFAAWLAFVAVWYARKGLAFAWRDWAEAVGLLAWAPRALAAGLGRDLLLAAGLWAGTAGLGGALRRRPAGEAAGLEARLVDAALGLGSLSLLLLGAGVAGGVTAAALRARNGAVVLAGLVLLWRGRGTGSGRPPLGGPAAVAALAIAAFIAAQNLLAAAAPEVFYDSLVYHLALPRLYLLRGAVVPTPENVYSGLPQGPQLLYGLALALSGDGLARVLHAAFGLGTALLLWSCVRRLAGPRAGALAALLFYACPLVVYAGWACGVDLASAFYVTAAASVLTAEAPSPALLGLLAGFAAGTKLNVLPVAGCLLLAQAWRERRLPGAAAAAAALAAATAPWLVKDAFFYGNPLYPFLHERLGTLKPADWKSFLEAAGSRDLRAALTTWEGFRTLVTLPLRCTLGDWSLGDWPGPVFVALAPAVLAARWRKEAPAAWTVVAALAVAGVLSWALASNLVRYAVPALPLAAAAVALAVERAAWPRWAKAAAWAAALAGSLLGYQCAFRQGAGVGQWAYLRGEVSRYDYLTRQRVTYGLPYFAAADWANKHLPADAKVLLLGESRGYYLERDFIAATVYDHNPFWAAAAAAKDDEDLRARLKAFGVTHILLSVRQLHFRHDSAAVLPRAVAGSDLVDRFFARWLDKLWEEREDGGDQPRWLTVYALRPSPYEGPAQPNPLRVVLDVLRKQGK